MSRKVLVVCDGDCRPRVTMQWPDDDVAFRECQARLLGWTLTLDVDLCSFCSAAATPRLVDG